MSEGQRARTVVGADSMHRLGQEIGSWLRTGDVVLLHGDLGAGKTSLTQGIAAELGIEQPVQSPTFTLVSEYPARLSDGVASTLYHLDLYRLTDPEELGDLGWDELIALADGVTVVEWPERAGDWLPERYLLVSITYRDATSRDVTIDRIG